jgi:hypothetical protein
MRRAATAIAIGASCAGVVACSLAASFDGFVGGDASAADAARGDASSSSGDGAAPDEGGAANDGAIVDGASQALDGGEGGGVNAHFCATHTGHTLCEDFDDSDALAPSWVPNVTDGAAWGVDTTVFVSPPRSFYATVSPVPGRASVEWYFSSGMTQVAFESNVRVSGTTNDVELMSVYFQTKNDVNFSDCYIDIGVVGGSAMIQASCNPQGVGTPTQDQSVIPGVGALAAWTRMRVVVDTTAPSVKAYALLSDGGTIGASATLPVTKPDVFVVGLGVSYTNDGTPLVHEDDVLVDVK